MAQSLTSSPVDVLSQSSRWADDSASDDEIVWSLSSSGELSLASRAIPGSPRSDDFILISRPTSPTLSRADAQALADAFSSMSMSPATSTNFQSTRAKPQPKNPKLTTNNNTITTATSSPATNAEEKPQPASPKRRRRKTRSRSKTPELEKTNVTDSYPSPPSSPAQNRTAAKSATTPPASPSKSRKAKKQTSALAAGAQAVVSGEGATTGLGQRTVVDDVSEFGDEKESPVYNEARDFMSKYLANPPPPGNNGSALLLCQALIIELGLNSAKPSSNASKPPTASYFSNPNLPRSLTQAKALLKSQAFISIRDYLDERERGPVALRNAMHGSRKSLVKDIRRTPSKRTPLKWVKQTGLNVLLVNTRA